jgi:hypothetical protein
MDDVDDADLVVERVAVSMDIGDCPWADVGTARWWPIRTAQWRTRICP